MPEAIVGVASNIRPEVHVPAALDLLDAALGILRRAPIYRTSPIERPEQDAYWNTAACVQAESLEGLRRVLHSIEGRLARVRTQDPYAPRTIDLDVLVWNGTVVDPDVPQRWFLQRLIKDLEPVTGSDGSRPADSGAEGPDEDAN